MTKSEMIETLRDKTRRLLNLLENPEPGLATWNIAVGRALTDLASFAPEPKEGG